MHKHVRLIRQFDIKLFVSRVIYIIELAITTWAHPNFFFYFYFIDFIFFVGKYVQLFKYS